jgi:hypothetical protein
MVRAKLKNRLWRCCLFFGAGCGLSAAWVVNADDFVVYTDRTSFLQALGSTSTIDNFGSYAAGQIANSNLLGRFYYSFDGSRTLPSIAVAGTGSQVLGGAPYGVFVGGDGVTLSFNQSLSLPLTAFGMTISYAPAAASIPAGTYTLTAQGGGANGQQIGNPALANDGGTFFVGVIANSSVTFGGFALAATQQDTNTIVPAIQVNELIYHTGTIPIPYFTGIVQTSSNTISLGGEGGLAGARFYLVTTTNLAQPRGTWAVLSTNAFDNSGAFSIVSVYNPTNPQAFFSLLPQ